YASACHDLYTLSLHDALPIFTVVHIGACFFLVLMILLQQSKGDGMGSAFGGGSSQSVLGSSAGNILTKIDLFGHRVYDYQFKSRDRKSTRLNSSHVKMSYAVF